MSASVPSARGWHVEVENARTGHVFRPRVVGEPQRKPAANELPRIEVPVPQDDKWLNSDFENSALRVWYDGEKQPVEEVERVEHREDTTILHGVGGEQLKDRVTVEYDTKEIHKAIRDLVSNNTTYTPNVDVPQSDTDTNVQQQSADTTTEFNNVVSPAASDPLRVNSGKLELLPTCPLKEAENGSYSGTFQQKDYNMSSDANDTTTGQAIEIGASVNDYVRVSVNTLHDIPSSNGQMIFRWGNPNKIIDNGPGLDFYIDGTKVGGAAAGFGLSSNWGWFDTGSETLNAGSHTLEIDVNTSTADASVDDTVWIDVIALEDTRFTHGRDNQVNSDHALSAPRTYPGPQQAVFAKKSTTKAVTGAKIDASFNDVSGGQEVAVSNDGGSTWKTKANSDLYETDFADIGTSVRWRGTFDNWGSRTAATPTEGFKGQSVDLYTLYADLSNIPVISDRNYDDSLLAILQDLSDKANGLFEYRDGGSTKSIEWATQGVRNSDKDPDVTRFSSTKGAGEIYEKVVVYGAAVDQQKESFTANHGVAVSLANTDIVPASEVVYSGSTVFTRGDDYTMNYRNGEITTLSSGSMTDGNSYSIDYRYKLRGTATADGVTNPNRTFVADVPVITTARTADQTARIIVGKIKKPYYEGRVVAPHEETGWSVIEDISFPDVPTGGDRVQMKKIASSPKQTVIEFGNRQTADKIVEDIRNRLSGVTKRV